MTESDEKIHKNIFSLKGSYRHVECSFDNFSEKFLTDTQKCPSLTKNDCKDETFSGKFWVLKRSPRHVRRSFDNPVKIYSRKNRMFFARALKVAKKDFQRKPLLKLFQWTVRVHFWQTWQYNFVRKQYFLTESPKVINRTLQLFCKTIFNSRRFMDTMNAVLTTQLINIRQNHGNFLLNVRKRWGKTQSGYFSKYSFRQVKCSSDNPVKKLSNKSENVPLNVGKRKRKVFIGMFFCSTCSHVHLESSFYNPVEKFVTKCRWFSVQHLKT